jgi:hypothetical protein
MSYMFVDKNLIEFFELSGNTTGSNSEDNHLSIGSPWIVDKPLTCGDIRESLRLIRYPI